MYSSKELNVYVTLTYRLSKDSNLTNRKSQVALAQFKGDTSVADSGKTKRMPSSEKSIQVLLMLIQHGANGLNLLEAQHVILVEPLLNPAAEAQAISRIHRVGQDKKTFIHRFIV